MEKEEKLVPKYCEYCRSTVPPESHEWYCRELPPQVQVENLGKKLDELFYHLGMK